MNDRISFRFPKEKRLRNKAEYDAMFHNSSRVSSGGITLRFKQCSTDCSRLGMMIGRKSGNAVERNRLRRIFREVFRQKKDFEILNVDLLVTLYKPLRDLENEEVRKIFNHLLLKINLQRKMIQI